MKYKVIKVSDRARERAERFADDRTKEDQSLYHARGSFKRRDIVIGAMAELGAYKFLRKHGFKVNKPDFTIYSVASKSYGADLMTDTLKFHVKGQDSKSAARYGNGWLMQRRDPLIRDVILHNYLIPCEVDLDTNKVTIFGVPSFSVLHAFDCFGECTLEHLRYSKVAIYKESIDFLSKKARWGVIQANRSNR